METIMTILLNTEGLGNTLFVYILAGFLNC